MQGKLVNKVKVEQRAGESGFRLEIINIAGNWVTVFLTYQTVSIIDLKTGKRVKDLKINWGNVSYNCVACTQDNKKVFAIQDTGEVNVYDGSFELITVIEKEQYENKPYTTVCLSPNDKFLITGPEGGILRVWDVESLELLFIVDCYMTGNQNLAIIATLYNIGNSGLITFDPNKVPLQYKITFPGWNPDDVKPFISNLEAENADFLKEDHPNPPAMNLTPVSNPPITVTPTTEVKPPLLEGITPIAPSSPTHWYNYLFCNCKTGKNTT